MRPEGGGKRFLRNADISLLSHTVSLKTVIPVLSRHGSVTDCKCLQKKRNELRGPLSASELYRLRDRLLSEKLSVTFADIGVLRGQRGGSPTVVNLSFLDRSRYFSFK
jgi:hypothetical protein